MRPGPWIALGSTSFTCDIMEAFFALGDIRFLGLVVFSGALNDQEMVVIQVPAIRFSLNRYGFDFFFKPDRSRVVSGLIH